jgi:hypothetical protein
MTVHYFTLVELPREGATHYDPRLTLTIDSILNTRLSTDFSPLQTILRSRIIQLYQNYNDSLCKQARFQQPRS